MACCMADWASGCDNRLFHALLKALCAIHGCLAASSAAHGCCRKVDHACRNARLCLDWPDSAAVMRRPPCARQLCSCWNSCYFYHAATPRQFPQVLHSPRLHHCGFESSDISSAALWSAAITLSPTGGRINMSNGPSLVWDFAAASADMHLPEQFC